MEVDFILKIAGIGIIVVILYQLLSKSGREEYATLTVIAGIVVIALMMIPQFTTLMDIVESTFNF